MQGHAAHQAEQTASGLWESLWGQLSRPLQVESLAASFLRTFGHPRIIATHGSLNIAGEGAVGAVSTIASWAAIAACWVVFARGAGLGHFYLLAPAVYVLAVLSMFTVVQRVVHVRTALRDA